MSHICVMRLLDSLLSQAKELSCHDLHFCPPLLEQSAKVYFRQEKHMVKSLELERIVWQQLVEQFKFHGGYRYDEQDSFQDLSLVWNTQAIRLAITPGATPYITARLHYKNHIELPLSIIEAKDKWIQEGGILLIAGPTKSGKTTNYYKILKQTLEKGYSIISYEDPIEDPFQPFMQICIKTEQDWKKALLASLRLDLDVIGLGEIRDLQTVLPFVVDASYAHLRMIGTIHAASPAALQKRMRLVTMLQDNNHPIDPTIVFMHDLRSECEVVKMD